MSAEAPQRPPPPSTRRERALATRRRMLRAAYELLRTHGYAGTTMEAIARRADVAVQTLYFTFGTKAAILEETVGAAVADFDHWVPPAGGAGALVVDSPATMRRYHDWFAPFEAATTPRAALDVFLGAGVDIMERAAPLTSMMRSAGDPDARAVYERGEANRARAFGVVVRVLGKKPPGLRRGLSAARATDVLLVLFSGETYQMLRERGWKPAEVRAFLLDVLSRELLAG